MAKVHKIWERRDSPNRLNDKDAHDAYRLLRSYETAELADTVRRLLHDELCGDVTAEAIDRLAELFRQPDALGAVMAGRAEEGLGDPEQVSLAVSILASDLVAYVGFTLEQFVRVQLRLTRAPSASHSWRGREPSLLQPSASCLEVSITWTMPRWVELGHGELLCGCRCLSRPEGTKDAAGAHVAPATA